MKHRIALCIALAAALVAPAWGQAPETPSRSSCAHRVPQPKFLTSAADAAGFPTDAGEVLFFLADGAACERERGSKG